MINAAALAIDVAFLSVATSGVSVATSSGSTALGVRNDLQNLARLVSTDARSRLFLATTSAIVKNIALMGATSSNGTPTFPEMSVQGGQISGVEVVVSDAVTQGQMILMDAQGFAGAVEPATLQVLKEGTITANDAQILRQRHQHFFRVSGNLTWPGCLLSAFSGCNGSGRTRSR